MLRWGVSDADVREALRAHGVERVDQGKRIALEPNGQISMRVKPS